MYKMRIIGAGSIGNHLAHAARTRDWSVTLTDIDPKALERAQLDIYPERYGQWDEKISLKPSDEALSDPADVVFIGTPPDSHIPLALETLERAECKVLLIEKPLCGPDLHDCQTLMQRAQDKGVFVAVGYNHCLAQITSLADGKLRSGMLGAISTISAYTREHWAGIFAAHPWLPGPQASYLGFSQRGGGALCEHSHAVNIWQHFAHTAGAGRVVEVMATLDMVTNDDVAYDRASFLSVQTENGLTGDIIQDVVTAPTQKSARIQGDDGFVEWVVNGKPGHDLVRSHEGEVEIAKTRPDDFIAEIDHLAQVMAGDITSSPIALERGLDTMLVIAAAFRSHETGRRVHIDWSKGYRPEALVC